MAGLIGCSSTDGADAKKDGGPVTYPPLDFSAIGTPVEISSQFLFTEGPVWDPRQQVLYFTDINGDTVYRLTLPDTVEPVLTPSQNPDGLALDPHGDVIVAGFASRSVWRLVGSSMLTIASSYQGKQLNSPDDLIARSDGAIYFTDPTFGISGGMGLPQQTAELDFQGVYRVTADGAVHLEDQTTSGPNGVVLSPDEHTLYVSYTATGEIAEFDIAADGSLANKTQFASGVIIADSMCVDAAGNLYVAALSGIVVLDSQGTNLGTIALNGEVPTNCTFGGSDQRTFFITARTSLTGTPTAGNSSLYRIDDMPIPGIPGRQ